MVKIMMTFLLDLACGTQQEAGVIDGEKLKTPHNELLNTLCFMGNFNGCYSVLDKGTYWSACWPGSAQIRASG